MHRLKTAALAATVFALGACGGESRAPAKDSPAVVGMPTGTDGAAPNEFLVRFETSKGPFVLEVHREWAPRGVDRFCRLVQSQYFDNVRFFRVVASFMAQFGMHGEPRVNAAWDELAIRDDSVRESNRRAYVSFATAGPNTRTTQLFINTVNNRPLDEMGFAPFARVIQGMAVVDSLFADYGDAPPAGAGPQQDRIKAEGNTYLEREFPKLDFIRTARIVADTTGAEARQECSLGVYS
ncbi:MAG: peptidylprolyl isomerase [Gemmatimonadaceae bacterium]